MQGFWREHGRVVLASVLLHGVVVALLWGIGRFSRPPTVVMPATMEGYLVPAAAARAAPVSAPAPEAAPAPTPAAPAPPVAPTQAQPKAAPTPKPTPKPIPPPKPLPDPRVVKREQAAKVSADAQQVAASKKQAEEAAKKQAAAADAKRREQEIAQKLNQAAEAERRAAREAQMANELAGEQKRAGVEHAGLLARYVAEIQSRVERAWTRPPTAKAGLKCEVWVTQVPGGTVTAVKFGPCNADEAVQQSISVAVFKASPLPAPPDPSLFERNLKLVFAPDA